VTDVGGWLSRRSPSPPSELSEALYVDEGSDPVHLCLQIASVTRLKEASSRPGARVGAFPLLAADALLTYACEAALESADPDVALAGLMDIGEVP